jgi:S-layer protein
VTNGSGNIIIDNTGLTTATNKTLVLNINGQTAGTLDDGDIYTTLNVTTSGADSRLSNLTFGGLTALTVAGDKALTLLSTSGASKLATVTVSGSAGLDADLSAATVTSVNASATSGDNTITLDATKATYTGGTGVDDVTTSVAAPTKAISLGAGNDSLTLANGTVSSTGLLDGGEGTDTLVMVAADAVSVSASNVFETKISNFERLSLNTVNADTTINLANLDDISYVSTTGNGITESQTLTLENMTNAGTLEITGDNQFNTVVVGMTDATGIADSFNIALASDASIGAGTVTVAGVETIAITSIDTDATNDNAGVNTLTVVAAAAKTITVSGDLDLSLTSANTTVTSVNASAMTADFIYTTATTAQTVTGGAGDDILTAGAGTAVQTLIGGAGDDTLITNAGLSKLTGGLGADTFVIQTPGSNVNIYATTDATIGDTIQFATLGTETFNATKLILGANAVFQDYANEAALAVINPVTGNAALSWFQFAGNTFVVEDRSELETFDNGTDLIVQLTGLVDLSNTSINTDTASLFIG